MTILTIIFFNYLTLTQTCQLTAVVEKTIKEQLPNSELVNKSKLIPNWTDFVDTDCPTIALGDFNGDSIDDYAILLTKEGRFEYQLVVVHSVGPGFELVHIMDIGFGVYDSGLGFGIEPYQPENVKGIEDQVNLKNVGILFTKFESSASIYYYKNGGYEKIWIAD